MRLCQAVLLVGWGALAGGQATTEEPNTDYYTNCADLTDANGGAWTDSYGDGCSYYTQYSDSCDEARANAISNNNNGMTALDACCVCEGGESLSTSTAATNDDNRGMSRKRGSHALSLSF